VTGSFFRASICRAAAAHTAAAAYPKVGLQRRQSLKDAFTLKCRPEVEISCPDENFFGQRQARIVFANIRLRIGARDL
jgi:hypothetical protein